MVKRNTKVHITKEADKYRDQLVGEHGKLDNVPMYTIRFKKKDKRKDD